MFLLSACSDNSLQKPTNDSPQALTLSGQVDGAFGVYEVGATVSDRILTFVKSDPSNLSTVSLSSSDFALVSTSGCNRELTKASDKCSVKVKFLKNKVAGSYSAPLTVGPLTVTLSATINSVPEPDISSFVEVQEGSSNVSSLDFEELKKDESLIKILSIKNNHSKPIAFTPSINSSVFSISSNTCASLSPNKICYVKVLAKGPSTLLSSDEIKTGSLDLGPLALSLSVTHKAQESNPALIQVYENSSIINALDFGPLPSGEIVKILNVKNDGGSNAIVTASLSGDSIFKIISSTCSSLAKGKNCFVKISSNYSQQSVGVKSGVLSLGAVNINLSAEVVSNVVPPQSNTVVAIIADTYNSDYTINTKFISKDMGLTYTAMVFPNTKTIQEVLVSGNNILFREDGPDTVYVSSNNGQSYSLLSNPNSEIIAAFMEGNTIILSTYDSGWSSNVFYISQDLGQNFAPLNLPAGSLPIQKVFLNSGKIYIQKAGSNIFWVSSDNGQNYTMKQSPNDILSQFTVSGNKIIVDTWPSNYSHRESYISLDGGDSFQPIDLISKISSYQQPYLVKDQLFITGSPLSMSVSNDNGSSFTAIPLSSVPNPNKNQLFFFESSAP